MVRLNRLNRNVFILSKSFKSFVPEEAERFGRQVEQQGYNQGCHDEGGPLLESFEGLSPTDGLSRPRAGAYDAEQPYELAVQSTAQQADGHADGYACQDDRRVAEAFLRLLVVHASEMLQLDFFII